MIALSAGPWSILTKALDVSFIPNDENAPLPLSKHYRDSLRKLCSLMNNSGPKLPPEILQKKEVLKKMCTKLAADDANAGLGGDGLAMLPSLLQNQAILLSLLGLGGGYALWCNRWWLQRQWRRRFGGGGGGGGRVLVGDAAAADAGAVGGGRGAGAGGSFGHSSAVSSSSDRMADVRRRLAETREARLKRFAQMNSGGEQFSESAAKSETVDENDANDGDDDDDEEDDRDEATNQASTQDVIQ